MLLLSDYSDEYWNTAFNEDDPTCFLAGGDGLLGQNGWYADRSSISRLAAEAAEGDQPLSLDFWRSSTPEAAVAGLPRYSEEAESNGTFAAGVWCVPPICKLANSTCGVAFGANIFYE